MATKQASSKGQIKLQWICEVIDFPNNQLKNLKDFCPDLYLKLNQKVVLITFWVHMTNLV